MPVGTDFSIAIIHEASGALDFPAPDPTNSRVQLLSRNGSVVNYRARDIGTVDLVAHRTRYCLALDPRIGSCHVIRITIGAR